MSMTPKIRTSFAYAISQNAASFIRSEIGKELAAHDGHEVRTGPRWGAGLWEYTCVPCGVTIGVDLEAGQTPGKA